MADDGDKPEKGENEGGVETALPISRRTFVQSAAVAALMPKMKLVALAEGVSPLVSEGKRLPEISGMFTDYIEYVRRMETWSPAEDMPVLEKIYHVLDVNNTLCDREQIVQMCNTDGMVKILHTQLGLQDTYTPQEMILATMEDAVEWFEELKAFDAAEGCLEDYYPDRDYIVNFYQSGGLFEPDRATEARKWVKEQLEEMVPSVTREMLQAADEDLLELMARYSRDIPQSLVNMMPEDTRLAGLRELLEDSALRITCTESHDYPPKKMECYTFSFVKDAAQNMNEVMSGTLWAKELEQGLWEAIGNRLNANMSDALDEVGKERGAPFGTVIVGRDVVVRSGDSRLNMMLDNIAAQQKAPEKGGPAR